MIDYKLVCLIFLAFGFNTVKSQNINYKNSIKEALNSLDLKENDIAIVTGSLYLAGEVLNLN